MSMNNPSHSYLEIAREGNLTELRHLHAAGQLSHDIQDEFGAGLLHYATRSGCLDLVVFLVKEAQFRPDSKTKLGTTPPHDAAASGHLPILSWMIKQAGYHGNTGDLEGLTVLHVASLIGHSGVVGWLIDDKNRSGCLPTDRTREGATALHFAALSGDLATIKLLVNKSPRLLSMQTHTGASPVFLAAQEGHLDALVCMSGLGGDLNQTSYDGMTCLHAAAQNGHQDTVQWLVFIGGLSLTQRDKLSVTPMHYAATAGHTETVQWMVEKERSAQMADKSGGTPLHYATSRANQECIRTLIKRGGNPEANDKVGLTPLSILDHSLAREISNATHVNGDSNGTKLTHMTGKSDSQQFEKFDAVSFSAVSQSLIVSSTKEDLISQLVKQADVSIRGRANIYEKNGITVSNIHRSKSQPVTNVSLRRPSSSQKDQMREENEPIYAIPQTNGMPKAIVIPTNKKQSENNINGASKLQQLKGHVIPVPPPPPPPLPPQEFTPLSKQTATSWLDQIKNKKRNELRSVNESRLVHPRPPPIVGQGQQHTDLIQELKKFDSRQRLRRTPSSKAISMVMTRSSGDLSMTTETTKEVKSNQGDAGDEQTISPSSLDRRKSVSAGSLVKNGDNTQENNSDNPPKDPTMVDFLSRVPLVNQEGKAIPKWKREMMARQLANNSKVKVKEDSSRNGNSSVWRQNISERKEATKIY